MSTDASHPDMQLQHGGAQTTCRRAEPLRLLIIEDSDDTAWIMATLLREAGYRVDIAPTGSAALRLAAMHPPDAVLLDLGLPGMSGLEVARLNSPAMQGKTTRYREHQPPLFPAKHRYFCTSASTGGDKKCLKVPPLGR